MRLRAGARRRPDGVLGIIQGDHRYDDALSVYRAWYPEAGGNLRVDAGRDLYGDSMGSRAQNGVAYPGQDASRHASTAVSQWLWRQGSGDTAGIDPIAASWWINFGTYTSSSATPGEQPRLVGFTGYGTLGGGNVTLSAGRHAGVIEPRGDSLSFLNGAAARSQGIVAAVAATGRVADGQLYLTGGGDLSIRAADGFNPGLTATQQRQQPEVPGRASWDNLDLNGVLVNLRGALHMQAGQVGGVTSNRSPAAMLALPDSYTATGGTAMGGPVLMLGDSAAWIDSRGDLVLGGAGDPGRVRSYQASNVFAPDGQLLATNGEGWFSLWTNNSAINLFSAGGSLVPMQAGTTYDLGNNLSQEGTHFGGSLDMALYSMYPGTLRAVAAGGNIVLARLQQESPESRVLMLAPSPTGQLELLAQYSLLGGPGSHGVARSGASPGVAATPFRPGFVASDGASSWDNYSREALSNSVGAAKTYFTFGPNTPTGLNDGERAPLRLYAAQGDIISVNAGSARNMASSSVTGRTRTIQTWYEAGSPVIARAGRDIYGLRALAVHQARRITPRWRRAVT